MINNNLQSPPKKYKPFVLKLFYFESNIDTSRDMRICCIDKITAIEFMEFLHVKKWKELQPEFGNPLELLKVTRIKGHLKRME